MTLPTAADFNNAKRDLDDLAEIVTSPMVKDVPNRAGGNTPTLAKVMGETTDFLATQTQRLAVRDAEIDQVLVRLRDHAPVRNRGAWITETTYEVNDIWQAASDVWYVVVQEYVSGETDVADIAGGNVFVHQVNIATDTVATIAELRLFEPRNDMQHVNLSGISVVGFGAARWVHFAGDTTSEDNGFDIVVTQQGKRWRKVGADIFTPLCSASVQFIAHRGLSRAAPENTLPAYEMAGKNGFWGAECDLQLTADGAWVLLHDSSIDRTTDGTGSISALTLAQVKSVDAGLWFSDYYSGTKIPTLVEFLGICRKYGMVPVMELKSGAAYSAAVISSLLEDCLRYFPNYEFVIISFSFGVLQQVRAASSYARLQLVVSNYSDSAVDQCVSLGRCAIDVGYASLPSSNFYAASRGVGINTWTVNDADKAKSAIEKGVSQITTDFLNYKQGVL